MCYSKRERKYQKLLTLEQNHHDSVAIMETQRRLREENQCQLLMLTTSAAETSKSKAEGYGVARSKTIKRDKQRPDIPVDALLQIRLRVGCLMKNDLGARSGK